LLIKRFKANRKKLIKATLLLSFFGIFGIGGVVAATSITINQGAPIGLGAGYTASTACDNAITINTQNQFINNQFMVSTISLSDIDATYPNGCGSSVLDLSLIVNGALVNASFSIASSASNNNYQFGGSAGTGFLANSVLTPFDISQLTSVALSAYKLTVVSYAVGDIGPGGGRVFYVSATPFSCGPTLNLTCSYLEAASTTGANPWTDSGRAWANSSYGNLDVTGITNNYPIDLYDTDENLLENTIGNVWFTYDTDGIYSVYSNGLFSTVDKCAVIFPSMMNRDVDSIFSGNRQRYQNSTSITLENYNIEVGGINRSNSNLINNFFIFFYL
jgi:hypothetical protein